MTRKILSTILGALLLGFGLVLPRQPRLQRINSGYAFAAELASTKKGRVQVYFDDGSGITERNSTIIELAKSDTPLPYRLKLPAGTFWAFRFDPIDRDGTVTVTSASVVDDSDTIVRPLALDAFRPIHQIRSATLGPGGLRLEVEPGADDPQTLITFDPPLVLAASAAPFLGDWIRSGLLASAALAVALWFLVGGEAGRKAVARAVAWAMARPVRAVGLAGALAVLASSWPVVFAGKSFVSPNLGAMLLYDEIPTLPGYQARATVEVKGSDVGAIMWQHVPYSAVEGRSVFRDLEWPIWDRDNSAGMPLLGQGQSMAGDPLNLFVMATRGAAWAWDIKFLAAKWLLAVGLGLCVYRLSRHIGAAMIVSFAAPIVGFFVYRVNHPAVFSFCYAPWILWAWLGIAGCTRVRPAAAWSLALVAADWFELTSGTVKEAFVLLLAINAAGALALLGADGAGRIRWRRLGFALGATILFAGLATPIWATFLETLRVAYTTSDPRAVAQIQPSLLLGLFDEALFRPLTIGRMVFDPASNFLFLGGLLYFVAAWRESAREGVVRGLALASVIAAGFVFGFIPASWIAQLPFLGNVLHIDNCFGCALILLSAVLAGLGFAAAARRLGGPEGRSDLAAAAMLLVALVFAYIGFAEAAHREMFGPGQTVTLYNLGEHLPVDGFVWGYLAALLAGLAGLAWLGRRAALGRTLGPAAYGFGALCLFALLWRQGQSGMSASWPDYVFRPTVRTDFHVRSPAIDRANRVRRTEPARAIGLQGNVFPGWTAMYGLEGINGPDALMNPYYRDLTAAAPFGKAWGWHLYLSRDNLAACRPFLDFLNVRFYYDLRSDQGQLGRVLKLVQPGDLDEYESPTVWPRAFFTDRLERYRDANGLVDLVSRGDGRPFAAVQESELGAQFPLTELPAGMAGRTIVPAESYHLTENSTAFSLDAPHAGLAVLTETFWAGYPHAQVDGVPAHVYRVNHAFIGIPVSAGSHRILVQYRPRNFSLMLLVSGISAGLLGLGWGLARRRPAALL